MKILLLNSEYPPVGGGAGHASAYLARHLAGMGHEVLLLTARFAHLPRHEQRQGVQIVRLPALRRRLDRSTALEQLAYLGSAALHSMGLVRRFRPDVSLAFFGLPAGGVAWWLRKLYRLPYVVSLRGGDVPGFRPYDFRLYHRLAAPFLRLIWHQAGAVVANSRGLRELALAFDRGVEIAIIPNGVEITEFCAAPRAWSPARILSVGRVVYQKGFDLGLRALGGLKELDWQWYIAGDGPQAPALQEMARRYGIRERVHMLGWQSTAQLKEQYAGANLFLFPSRHEGMPNAVLEAMASGLPILASRIAGNEELVQDGVSGVLVPAEDVAALQEALRRLLVQEAMRKQMGAAARQRVEAHYSWQSVARQYAQLLESVA